MRREPNFSDSGAAGSGFFIADNKLLTCYHVISTNYEQNRRIRVEYGGKIVIAEVLKVDPERDIALLQAEVENEKILKIAVDRPKIDAILVAKGHPKAKWNTHYTDGVLKEIQRKIFNNKDGKFESRHVYKVADIAIVGGMSGGPLLNKDNEVVGMTKSVIKNKEDHTKNIGFFVSRRDLEEFIK